MTKSVRVIELAENLKISHHELIAVCALLEISATSNISCLTKNDVEKIIKYYKQ